MQLSARATPEPLAELFRAHYERMVRLAYVLTGDEGVAEELVQDAFLAVHRSGDRAESPVAYLRAAVVNNCRSWGRRRRLEHLRRPSPDEPDELVVDELWHSLQRLPERQRAAIILRFYEDLPDNEIARLLGCRPATVRTSVHRGLNNLRKEVVR